MNVIREGLANYLPICRSIKAAGGSPYLVGGCVRDRILRRDSKDIDIVVVGLSHEELDSVILGELGGELVGKSFPVYKVGNIDVAAARREWKVDEGYHGFECSIENVTLREDQRRRDLSINSIAMDPFTGEIIDPFHGEDDIYDRMLLPVSDAFGDDPLRVVRAARFAAQFEMVISVPLMEQAKRVLGELDTLSPERVFTELSKALRSPYPSRFFRALDKMGALEILFPEIHDLKGRIQPEKYHPEGDAYIHTLLVIDRARELGASEAEIFGALVHDLGKAVTPDNNLPHHYDHETLGVPLVEAMCDRLLVPNEHRRIGVAAAREHLNVHRYNRLRTVKRVRLLKRLNAAHGDDLVRSVVLVSQADAQGRGPELKEEPYPQADVILADAAKFRTVSGEAFAGQPPERIAQSLEKARAQALEA